MILITVMIIVLAACGDGDNGSSAADGGSSGTEADQSQVDSVADSVEGGQVVDMQPPGQATASVDGQEYTLDTVGPVGCDITDSEFNVGFIMGDNDVSVIAGGTASGSEWRGRIDLNVQTTDGIANYFADFSGGDAGAVAVSDASMSYSGEWKVYGSDGTEESVGDGTLSLTCG